MEDSLHDFSAAIEEMKESDPDIASELRDRRTNWDLRDRIEKLDDSTVMICKLWAFRNPDLKSEKQSCKFCTRNVAVAEAASKLNLNLVCLLCWFRAGRPFEEKLVQIGDANA